MYSKIQSLEGYSRVSVEKSIELYEIPPYSGYSTVRSSLKIALCCFLQSNAFLMPDPGSD